MEQKNQELSSYLGESQSLDNNKTVNEEDEVLALRQEMAE